MLEWQQVVNDQHMYIPLQDIWNKLFVSNFLNTLPLSSTKLLDTSIVISALLYELMATLSDVA